MYLIKRVFRSISSRKKTFLVKKRKRKKEKFQLNYNLGAPEVVIWIFGCQRSGTTFLENIFRQDFNSVVFGEFSELTITEGRTVLSNKDNIFKIVHNKNAKYAVIRPLFESDRANELLNIFPNSVGVWMFRDFYSVIDSMKRKWNNDFFLISKKVESDEQNKWRLLDKYFKQLQEINSKNVDEFYGQYWYDRNLLPFVQNLHKDERVLFIEYNKLVNNPEEYIQRILNKTSCIEIWSDIKVSAFKKTILINENLNMHQKTIEKSNLLYSKLLALTYDSNSNTKS